MSRVRQEYEETEKRLRENPSNFDADGNHLAPNGKPSNLTYEQWVQVRTPAFKKWFGDWEGREAVNRIVDSRPFAIDISAIPASPDLKAVKTSAANFGKTLTGTYTNLSDGFSFNLTTSSKFGSLKEILEHDYKDVHHLQSIAAIPYIAENSQFITELKNDNPKKPEIDRFRYYVSAISIDGFEYMVKSVVSIAKDGNRYYDHKLTELAKIKESISSSVNQKQTDLEINSSHIKDKRLLQIIQEIFTSSKVVDENGEPQVVYHVSNNKFSVFDNRKSIDHKFWFTDNLDAVKNGDISSNGKSIVYQVYLNIRRPAGWHEEDNFTMQQQQDRGFDGQIFPDDKWTNYTVFSPNQIKSATDNRGTFDGENPNILFQTAKVDDEYFKALDEGDIETAQRIVDDLARLKGYLSNDDYHMMHHAPTAGNDLDVNLVALAESDLVPADYWEHPERYGIQYETGGWESFNKIKRAMDSVQNGKSPSIRFYRAVPATVKEDYFRNGDWITPSKTYAIEHAKSNIDGPYRIISRAVKASDAWWNADSINEWGYNDGKNYAYRNTRNNRKLLDVITHDEEGNIIPPSKRFNYRNYDVLFQTAINDDVDSQIDDLTEESVGIPNKTIRITEHTPTVFKVLGLPNLPVEMYVDKLARGLFLDKSELHGHSDGLTKNIVKQVLHQFADPWLVFDSKHGKGNIVAIYDVLDKNGQPVMASIRPNAERADTVEINLVTSLYGRPERQIQKWIDSGLLRYVDDTKKPHHRLRLQLRSAGDAVSENTASTVRLQLPSADAVSGSIASTNNVLYKSSLVNNEFHNKDDGGSVNTDPLFLLSDSKRQEYQELSDKFDADVDALIAGSLPENHVLVLGKPDPILSRTGFPEGQNIELSASHLRFKARIHDFVIEDVKGLVMALLEPVAVFRYGDGAKAQNVIVDIRKGDKNFLVGMHFNQERRGTVVSDIRGLFPKETSGWLNWISQGKLLYADKMKLQEAIAQQQTNSAEVGGSPEPSDAGTRNPQQQTNSAEVGGSPEPSDAGTRNPQQQTNSAEVGYLNLSSVHRILDGTLDVNGFAHDSSRADATPLFQLSEEKRQEYLDARKRDVKEAVENHFYVGDGILSEYAGEEWADREIRFRQASNFTGSLDEARQYAEREQYLDAMREQSGEEHWNEEEEEWYKRVWDYSRIRTPQQSDRIFLQQWAGSEKSLLALAARLKGYSDVSTRNGKQSVAYRFASFKDVDRRVTSLSMNSSDEQIREAMGLVYENPRAYNVNLAKKENYFPLRSVGIEIEDMQDFSKGPQRTSDKLRRERHGAGSSRCRIPT